MKTNAWLVHTWWILLVREQVMVQVKTHTHQQTNKHSWSHMQCPMQSKILYLWCSVVRNLYSPRLLSKSWRCVFFFFSKFCPVFSYFITSLDIILLFFRRPSVYCRRVKAKSVIKTKFLKLLSLTQRVALSIGRWKAQWISQRTHQLGARWPPLAWPHVLSLLLSLRNCDQDQSCSYI